MGNLDLERVVWPNDSDFAGADLDILARKALFEIGLDYKHGTGHGVGSTLCVHEGPQGISRKSKTPLKEGMCISNEPGYYKDGEFGIRIENVNIVQQHPKYSNRFCFENMTFAPFSRELIDTSILNNETIEYINVFHQRCLIKLTPLLSKDPRALKYV
jgi:Xaa-Pro aminopeptidase